MQFQYIVLALLTFAVCISANAQTKTSDKLALFPIEENKKWGYIDRNGKVLIEPRFDYGSKFSEGLAAVQINGKWGFIDENGKPVIEAGYTSAYNFSEGLARVQTGGDKYGLTANGDSLIVPVAW